jgi:hypothetical protein
VRSCVQVTLDHRTFSSRIFLLRIIPGKSNAGQAALLRLLEDLT